MARTNIKQMSPDAQASIRAGVKTGNVRFENNPDGGEYIYSGDKSFGANKASVLKKIKNRGVKAASGAVNVGIGAAKAFTGIVGTAGKRIAGIDTAGPASKLALSGANQVMKGKDQILAAIQRRKK